MYLSTTQACAKIGVGRATLAKLIRDGKIVAFKGEGKNGHIRIPDESVTAYLATRRIGVPAGGAK